MLPTVLDFRAWTGFRKETCNRDANDIRVITGWRSGASIAGARTTGAGSRPTISRVANIPVDWCRSAVAFPRRCSIQQQTVHRLQDSGQNGQISHYRVWWRIGAYLRGTDVLEQRRQRWTQQIDLQIISRSNSVGLLKHNYNFTFLVLLIDDA